MWINLGNWKSIVIGLVVGVIVIWAIIVLVNNKKSGKSSCGGSCEGCSLKGECRKNLASQKLCKDNNKTQK